MSPLSGEAIFFAQKMVENSVFAEPSGTAGKQNYKITAEQPEDDLELFFCSFLGVHEP